MATVQQLESMSASNEAARKADLNNFTATNNSQIQQLIGNQNAQQQGLFNEYTAKMNSQEKLTDTFTRLQNEQDIPGITNQLQTYKDAIYRTKTLLDNLDENITNRTRGTLTSEAQRNRIIGDESSKYNRELAGLGTGMQPITDRLTSAQNYIATQLPLISQDRDRELQPLTMQINSLSDIFAREITGFTMERENSLNALMDSIERGRQLDDAQLAEAQKLAAAELEYSRQRALAAQQASYNYLQPQNTVTNNTSSVPRPLPTLSVSSPTVSTLSLQSAPSTQNKAWGAMALQGGNGVLQGGSGFRLQ